MAKKYDFDEEDGVWRTVGGRRIFIREGQSLSTAMKESGKFKSAKKSKEPEKDQYKSIKDSASGYWESEETKHSQGAIREQLKGIEGDKEAIERIRANPRKYIESMYDEGEEMPKFSEREFKEKGDYFIKLANQSIDGRYETIDNITKGAYNRYRRYVSEHPGTSMSFEEFARIYKNVKM